MNILVFSSCTKSKKFEYEKQPECSELINKHSIDKYVSQYPQYSCKAKEMYRGAQHKNLFKGINRLQEIASIDPFIISAGLGIIPADKEISSYECTFTGKTKKFIKNRSDNLNIMTDFQKIVNQKDYDLIYLALGKDYLKSIDDWENVIKTLTIAFTQADNPKVLSLEANNQIVSRFSASGYTIHGVIGFKGDLLRIFTEKVFQSENPPTQLEDILKDKKTLNEFIRSFLS